MVAQRLCDRNRGGRMDLGDAKMTTRMKGNPYVLSC
jgi:hypothetical protein